MLVVFCASLSLRISSWSFLIVALCWVCIGFMGPGLATAEAAADTARIASRASKGVAGLSVVFVVFEERALRPYVLI